MSDDVGLAGRTVIIADDDDLTRGLLRSLLRVAGLEVVAETGTGERTIAAYERLRPEIVCLDIDMPDLNGLEVLSRIRTMSAETIIIMISGETTAENIRKAVEAKADGVIAKPFNTARLTSTIEQSVRKRRAVGGLPQSES